MEPLESTQQSHQQDDEAMLVEEVADSAGEAPRKDLPDFTVEGLMREFAKDFVRELKGRWNAPDGAIGQLDKTYEERAAARKAQAESLEQQVAEIRGERDQC